MSLQNTTALPCAGHVNTAEAELVTFYPCPQIDRIKAEHCEAQAGCALLRAGLVRITGEGCTRVMPTGHFEKTGVGKVNWIQEA